MRTTLNLIKEKRPCSPGWETLLIGLGKTQADDEPLSIAKIIETNDVRDALWALRAVVGYDREKRLLACWCCDQIAHLITDERSKNAVVVARKFANGEASREELSAAAAAAASAADDASASADASAADDAAAAAYAAAAYAAAAYSSAAVVGAGAYFASRAAQATELLRICSCVDRGEDPYPKQGEEK